MCVSNVPGPSYAAAKILAFNPQLLEPRFLEPSQLCRALL